MEKGRIKQNDRRKTYKFSSCICQGGWVYVHRTKKGEKIKDKDKLRRALEEVSKIFGLIDVTIKIYDSISFLFFMIKPTVKPIDIIGLIQKSISEFADWDEKYLYNGVYDLQEWYLRDYLKKFRINYNEG